MEKEHIFFDIRSSFRPSGGVDLLRKKWTGKFLLHRLVPGALQYFTVPFFLLLIYYTLFGPNEHNLGNVIAWSLLWPFLLLSVFVSARSFCAYCPISAVSDMFTLFRTKFLPYPALMKKYGLWVGIAAYISIFWIEHVAEAFTNAHITGMVFLAISGSAIMAALLFGKRIWCIHICPLGSMLGGLSALSILELRANGVVCVWQCENRPCLRENNCPMGLHPSSERTRHDCILCLNCVRKCKQKSVHLDLLRPHERILAMKSWDLPRTVFVMLLIGSVLASQVLKWFDNEKAFAAWSILRYCCQTNWQYFVVGLIMAAGFTAVTFLASKSGARTTWSRNFVYAGSAYLPLAFFGLFNLYFGQFISQAGEIPRLSSRFMSFDSIVDLQQPALLTTILIVITHVFSVAGGVLSLYLLKKLRDRHRLPSDFSVRHQLIIIATCIVFLLVL